MKQPGQHYLAIDLKSPEARLTMWTEEEICSIIDIMGSFVNVEDYETVKLQEPAMKKVRWDWMNNPIFNKTRIAMKTICDGTAVREAQSPK